MSRHETDYISIEEAGSLHGLLKRRAERSPKGLAYRQFDPDTGQWRSWNWSETMEAVARWQSALVRESLQPGDRVAIMMRNGFEWMLFDQAALGLGLVVVPLYVDDRPENVAYVLSDSGARVLMLGNPELWHRLRPALEEVGNLARIVIAEGEVCEPDQRLRMLGDWIPAGDAEPVEEKVEIDGLATIVYTSGTTGRPKGVMLSHRNILWNVWAGLQAIEVYPDDIFLSFLPLSHTLERSIGYYLPVMSGAAVVYARGIPQLAEDLLQVRPTILVSVPRIYERIFNRIQEQLAAKPPFARRLFELAVETGWEKFRYHQGYGAWRTRFLLLPLLDRLVGRKVRARLGGRIRLSVCGGAPLPPVVSRFFIGLGIVICQGYGLTETSPVISVNRLEDNEPESVGEPLQDVEVKLGENDELLARSPGVMLGYWNRPEATAAIIDDDGWLHTGDKARILRNHIYITGRIKEIIVLSNGEKVPPADMEMAITADPVFEQAMIVGEGRPYLAALVVLNDEALAHEERAPQEGEELRAWLLQRICLRLGAFPGYAQVRALHVCDEAWTIDNGLITPTMKLKRDEILKRYREVVEEMYRGH